MPKFSELQPIDRVQFILSIAIKISLVIAAVLAVVEKDWTTVFVSIISLIAVLIPSYFARSYKFDIPVGFEFILVIFIYATLFLGEVHEFYTKFWWWDVILHTGSGVAFGFIGFLILYYFYRNKKFEAPNWLISLFAFSVSLAIGVVWEIFEFAMDSFFGLNMQKSGLVDTMWDLIVNTVGALIAAVSGFLYLHSSSKGMGVFRYYVNSFFRR